MTDRVSGFVSGDAVHMEGAADGPLKGLRFAAKDIFDVAGHVTGGGNPDWARTHGPAAETAPAVQKLLNAGATLAGKTITDELTRGILGINARHGTPVNPRAPDRVPGGSSSGSASVVAEGLVDFALGSDTGGSVRVPASFCGIYGIRPTHGRVPLTGVIEQAPSFDTVGWFADDAGVLERVGAVLLDGDNSSPPFSKLVVAEDAFAIAGTDVNAAVAPVLEIVKGLLDGWENLHLCPTDLAAWQSAMFTVQQWEAHRSFADWIDRVNPRFSYDVAQRFVMASKVSEDDVKAVEPVCRGHRQRMEEVLAPETVIALPTAPAPAPLRGLRQSKMQEVRRRIVTLTCIAGGAGLPQVSLPVTAADGLPVGLSLIGPRGSDEMLLSFARSLIRSTEYRRS
jgi:amidase